MFWEAGTHVCAEPSLRLPARRLSEAACGAGSARRHRGLSWGSDTALKGEGINALAVGQSPQSPSCSMSVPDKTRQRFKIVEESEKRRRTSYPLRCFGIRSSAFPKSSAKQLDRIAGGRVKLVAL